MFVGTPDVGLSKTKEVDLAEIWAKLIVNLEVSIESYIYSSGMMAYISHYLNLISSASFLMK